MFFAEVLRSILCTEGAFRLDSGEAGNGVLPARHHRLQVCQGKARPVKFSEHVIVAELQISLKITKQLGQREWLIIGRYGEQTGFPRR